MLAYEQRLDNYSLDCLSNNDAFFSQRFMLVLFLVRE